MEYFDIVEHTCYHGHDVANSPYVKVEIGICKGALGYIIDLENNEHYGVIFPLPNFMSIKLYINKKNLKYIPNKKWSYEKGIIDKKVKRKNIIKGGV